MAYEQEHPLINGASNNAAASTPDTLGGGWIVASLSSSTDLDYFKVSTVSAALIRLDLNNPLVADTAYWNLSLLNSSGDYVTSLSSSISGAPLVDGTNSGTTLAVSGLTSAVPVGSRFTFATSAADTTIYTVTSATTVSSGTSTLTLDQALPTGLVANTALVFDPAQSLIKGVNGVSASLTGQVAVAGTYFVKVSAASWTDAEYSVRASVLPTVESTGDNNTKDAAVASATTDQNRPVESAWMTGSLSDANDADFWVFSTATMAGDIKLDFAAASGDNNSPEWEIKLTRWVGDQPLTSVQGVPISATAGASRSFTIEAAKYSAADTFVIEVVKASGVTVDTGTYMLRLSGPALDLNDTPIITIDSVTSTKPYVVINTGVNRSIKAAADNSVQAELDSKVSLSTLFGVGDADTGQTIASYKVALSRAIGETGSVTGLIVLIEANGTRSHTYAMDTTIALTAAEMAKAYLLPGTVTGDMSLALQAFDSSGALDNSGASSVMLQTLRVVNSAVGVAVATDGALSLQEGNSSTETLSFSLGTAPTQNVKVYLEQDTNSRFDFGASVLTFNKDNFSTPQTILVTARDNHFIEGTHSGQISFRVVSADSQYDGYNITPLTVTITEPVNQPPTGGISFTGTVTEDQVLTAATSSLVDPDTLGTLLYQWQRSTDSGANWIDINSATASTYTLGDADVGNTVRLAVSYIDGHGTTETVYSAPSSTVSNINDAPTGSVTVGGTVTQGQTLTVTNTLADADGIPVSGTAAITYQWQADGATIGGATATTLVLSQAQVGKVITVVASYIDNYGHAESVTSSATTAVANINDAPTAADKTLTTNEDTQLVLTATDFGFSDVDAGAALASVKITTLESAGALKYNGADVTPNQVITKADIDANKLTFDAAANANGAAYATFGFTVNDGTADSAVPNTITVNVTAVNDAPTLTTFSSTIGTVAEDTQATITLANLAAQGNEVDVDGTVTGFVVKAISSGALKIGADAASALVWASGTNDLVDATHIAYWTGDLNANGILNAFAAVAKDNSGAESATAIQATVNVTAVNDAPTLTTFASTIGTVAEDTQAPITLVNLAAQGNEVDVDGTVTGFVVKAISSGTLKIGADAATAAVWASGTNDLVDATHIAYWTGDLNANGILNAFTAVAKDNSGAESATAIQATVNVTAVNDAPTGGVSISGTATQGVTLTASNDLADVDGIPTSGIGAISYQWLAGGLPISGANTGTYVLTSAEVGKTVTVVASYADNDGHAESVTSAATSSVTAIVGKTVDVVVNTWKTAAPIEGVSINGSSYSGTSSASGATSFSSVTEANLNLTASRTVPGTETTATSAAVNLQDAIAILKMIVGLPVNGANQPLSPYQSLAADFDGNGTVGLTDAIGVLKHVVGLSAPEPTWHFVNAADTSLSGINPLNPGSPPAISVDLSGISPVQVGLVGYLTGDVDGSFIK